MATPQLVYSPEVSRALAAGTPLVALESTILCHGMPYPDNVSTALEVEDIIRANGAGEQKEKENLRHQLN